MESMMQTVVKLTVVTAMLVLLVVPVFAEEPRITGKPVIDAPELLEWPYDRGVLSPNLNDPTSNTLHDFHGNLSSCDLVLSTEGNYHPALRDVWPIFLAKFKDQPLANWLYITSPPVVVPQLEHEMVQFGNLYTACKPQVAVATGKVIKRLQEAGHTDGQPHALYRDRGSVILVKKGNPKNIQSVWDLGRDDVQFITPNPTLEPGAFGNYASTIYHIAANDPSPPQGITAEELMNRLFNGVSQNPHKWLAGPRIHHRDLPWSVACGKADAAMILYHLGLYCMQTFPEKFDIIPLGGTVSDPQPLKGTPIGTRFVVRIKGEWTPRQIDVREKLIQTLLSDDFTGILKRRGMVRPEGFVPVSD